MFGKGTRNMRKLHVVNEEFEDLTAASRAALPRSPVLTATGLVNGRWQFSTPYIIDTP